ncbi:metallophosphoesterase family protein [Arachidicoccus ginsenosidivorans]
MRTFVMGDIHGAFKAMKQCLQRSDFDIEKDCLIQLGDIVDGYEDVFECIETLLSIKNKVLIKGNHDDWFRSFFETDYHPALWQYGGKGTLLSYLRHAGKKTKLIASGRGFKSAFNASDIPATHKKLFESQKLYFVDEQHRCFLHAGFDRHLPFTLQKETTYYWDRELLEAALQRDAYYEKGVIPEGFYNDAPFKEIFIGHTPTTHIGDQTDKPLQVLNITDLDTGAGHQGRLTIMELPETAADFAANRYWQSDPLTQLYANSNR